MYENYTETDISDFMVVVATAAAVAVSWLIVRASISRSELQLGVIFISRLLGLSHFALVAWLLGIDDWSESLCLLHAARTRIVFLKV